MNPTTTPESPSANVSSNVNTAASPRDEELMAAIQQRDPRALETLLERYRGLLKSVILRVVHDHATADDVLQDCLVEIWNHADHYCAKKGQPLGWIVTLGKRRAIDCLRRQVAYCGAKDRLEEATRHRSFTQDSDCEEADLGRILQQHLATLPDSQREVIRLAFLDGMSQREVARHTHTPLGTVKTRIELGLRKLRTAFRTQNAMHTLQSE